MTTDRALLQFKQGGTWFLLSPTSAERWSFGALLLGVSMMLGFVLSAYRRAAAAWKLHQRLQRAEIRRNEATAQTLAPGHLAGIPSSASPNSGPDARG